MFRYPTTVPCNVGAETVAFAEAIAPGQCQYAQAIAKVSEVVAM